MHIRCFLYVESVARNVALQLTNGTFESNCRRGKQDALHCRMHHAAFERNNGKTWNATIKRAHFIVKLPMDIASKVRKARSEHFEERHLCKFGAYSRTLA